MINHKVMNVGGNCRRHLALGCLLESFGFPANTSHAKGYTDTRPIASSLKPEFSTMILHSKWILRCEPCIDLFFILILVTLDAIVGDGVGYIYGTATVVAPSSPHST